MKVFGDTSRAYQLPPHIEGDEVRLVRMTPELMEALVWAAAGRGHKIDWGEPDRDGFYEPTVTLTVKLSQLP